LSAIPAPLYFINIGIADACGGAVLSYILVGTKSDIGKKDSKKLVDIIVRSLKKLPAGTPADKK
jgi:hypothetical protein